MALRTAIALYSKTFVVVDMLDECRWMSCLLRDNHSGILTLAMVIVWHAYALSWQYKGTKIRPGLTFTLAHHYAALTPAPREQGE
jgi:hypothetical protein